MNNFKMIMEEVLPFYFLVMVFSIAWFDHTPTMFELIIVYAFAFGVAIFNNHLYKKNEEYREWGTEVIDVVDILQKENKYLRDQLQGVINELEAVNDEVDKEESK